MLWHSASIGWIAGKREGRAGRMKNDQIPKSGGGLAQNFHEIALNVTRRFILGGKQVATPRVMTASEHGTADNAAKFTTDEYFHFINFFAGGRTSNEWGR